MGNKTTNSKGEIVPGSYVIIKSKELVYEVGQIKQGFAELKLHNKVIGKFPIDQLKGI